MLSDIFSSLDFQNSNLIALSLTPWLMGIAPLTIALLDIWNSPQPSIPLLHSFINLISAQNSTTTGNNFVGFSSILIPVFALIIVLNLSGLFPYLLSTTSHLLLNLTIAVTLWLSLIISSITNCFRNFITLLLPAGAPGALNPFLTLAEILSTSVRPITLSVRLTANIAAGHTVITLLCSYLTTAIFSSSPLIVLLALIASAYTTFEVAICLIQATIFSILLTIYTDEHSTPLNRYSFRHHVESLVYNYNTPNVLPVPAHSSTEPLITQLPSGEEKPNKNF